MRDEVTESWDVLPHTDVREMAVRLLLTREVTRAQIARDLGIGMPTLSRWVRDVIDQSPYGDVLESLHDEVGVLRKENAALQKMLVARNGKGAPNATGAARPE